MQRRGTIAALNAGAAMIYKFKSKASGDIIMLGAHGDTVLRLLGREPSPTGIIEVVDMTAAIIALRRAADAADVGIDAAPRTDGDPDSVVSLRRRVWPLIEMLQRAQAAAVPIVWGV